ncbi:MAG: DUF4230 domain-containing protein [Eubacteriales bacterium]|nr:DUF4230 domain-containing protein [Clostridiales bacterium]MDO5594891.1 DUF4230 domain-containing protein [Eubacteriales bacterium]
MKKIVGLMMTFVMVVLCASCAAPAEEDLSALKLQEKQIKAICELAVMDCYYHNVAKFTEEDAQGALWWKKDKRFWVEYSGVVQFGVDVSQVEIVDIQDTTVKITLPEAKVLGCKVDSSSLSEDSFIVDKDSADIEAGDEVAAFDEAQRQLEKLASSNKALLGNAQQRAQELLGEYVRNIGAAVGKDYQIEWVYLDSEGNPAADTTEPEATSEETE